MNQVLAAEQAAEEAIAACEQQARASASGNSSKTGCRVPSMTPVMTSGRVTVRTRARHLSAPSLRIWRHD
jgi:hypothetical protein